MPWGKYRGVEVDEIPSGYLCWLLDESNAEDAVREAVREVLAGRYGLDEERVVHVHLPFAKRLSRDQRLWAVRLIEAGYRHLSLKHHPDVGGRTDDMGLINTTRDQLIRELETKA